MEFPIEVNISFTCQKCGKAIDSNYTQSDIMEKEYLEFTCQSCGCKQNIETSMLIEKAEEKAIEEIKKAFGN